MIIGLAGRAGAGKDTVAKVINDHIEAVLIAFAQPVRDAVVAAFRLSWDQVLDPVLKEEIIPDFGLSPRQLLQRFGTEFARNMVSQDVWIIVARRRMKTLLDTYPQASVVFTDLRFENERAWLRSIGAEIWHIDRPGVSTAHSGHPSETPLIRYPDELIVPNTGTKEELYARVRTLLDQYPGRALARSKATTQTA